MAEPSRDPDLARIAQDLQDLAPRRSLWPWLLVGVAANLGVAALLPSSQVQHLDGTLEVTTAALRVRLYATTLLVSLPILMGVVALIVAAVRRTGESFGRRLLYTWPRLLLASYALLLTLGLVRLVTGALGV